jgi:hypothetical protein
MQASRRLVPAAANVLVLLAGAPIWAEEPVPVGRLLPLAVHEGRCECVLPTGAADAKYFLVLGVLAQGAGPHRVSVHTESTPGPPTVSLETTPPDTAWKEGVGALHRRLAQARQQEHGASAYPPAPQPPRERTFYLFTGEKDFHNADEYTTIRAELQEVGRHCQVYLDRSQAEPAALRPTIADIVRTFDDEIYPRSCRELGQALDVDRDGRFTILLSGWLGKLQDGKVALGGFVRGSDFYRDLPAPFGNRCDLMYLNTDLRPGPHLRTLLAHEHTHAVIFSQHVFGGYLPEIAPRDEESWLNEGVAHLAEDLHGYGWSNRDYRISAFLNAPRRYSLVVPDYYGAGLWRDPGHRGAAYLLLRWCTDRCGADLPKQLAQSSLSGIANLETATRQRFADLFRAWSAALLLSGTHLAEDDIAEYRSIELRQPLGRQLLCGPRCEELKLSRGDFELRMAATSVAHLLLHSPDSARARLLVTADPAAQLQVTLVRLPRRMGRLSLHVQAGERPGTCVVTVTAHDAPVTLAEAVWEREVPAADRPEDTSYRTGTPAGQTARAWFGEPHMQPGESRTSPSLVLPDATGPFVFKVTAIDATGHRLTAWATK